MPPIASRRSSRAVDRRLGVAFLQQVFLLAGQDELVLLVVYADPDRHDSGGALWGQRRDGEARVQRVAGIDRIQELRRLLDERDQRVADHMGEGAGAGGGEAQHLKPVRQRAGMAALAAIFDIVMDRMVVGRYRLKGGEIGVGDGAARNVEALADRQILEKPALRKTVLPPVETLAVSHVIAPLLPSRCRIKRAGAGRVNLRASGVRRLPGSSCR